MKTLLVLSLFCLNPVFAAIDLHHSIPRSTSKKFVTDGLFEGGKNVRANIEDLRFSSHAREGFERWVIDFSDGKSRSVGTVAPAFQLRYVKADKIIVTEGKDILMGVPRFIFTFRSIHKNYLLREKLKKLAQKSQFVKDIILYPPIEQGDTALEFILNDDVLFAAHQPLKNEGRLVLDIRRSP